MTTIDWGEGLALRYGGFYGPGTSVSLAPDAATAVPIRKRQFPIVDDDPAPVREWLPAKTRSPRSRGQVRAWAAAFHGWRQPRIAPS